jgi:hypothetical protein
MASRRIYEFSTIVALVRYRGKYFAILEGVGSGL